MYGTQKKYTFIAALLMSFITGGALFGMEEAKIANPAVFEELPLELNRPILLKWLERTLGYNYTSDMLLTSITAKWITENFEENLKYNNTTDPRGFLIPCQSLLPTCNTNLVLIAGYKDVILYNIQTQEIEKQFKTKEPIQQIAINTDKTKVAGAQGKEIFLWDLSTEEKGVTLTADEILYSVTLSPDGKFILAGGSQDIYLWDISTKSLVKKIKVTTNHTKIHSVSFNRKSNKILSSTQRGETIIWDLQGNKVTTCVEVNSLSCALFSRDEHSIIVAGIEGITLFDAHTGKIHLTNSEIGSILSLAYSPDGNTLIAGSEVGLEIYVIDLKTARVLTKLENVGRNIVGVCFTLDGNNIISASGQGVFYLHRRSKEEDNEWATTRKETALELYLELKGRL